jgi:hypothetical protein
MKRIMPLRCLRAVIDWTTGSPDRYAEATQHALVLLPVGTLLTMATAWVIAEPGGQSQGATERLDPDPTRRHLPRAHLPSPRCSSACGDPARRHPWQVLVLCCSNPCRGNPDLTLIKHDSERRGSDGDTL